MILFGIILKECQNELKSEHKSEYSDGTHHGTRFVIGLFCLLYRTSEGKKIHKMTVNSLIFKYLSRKFYNIKASDWNLWNGQRYSLWTRIRRNNMFLYIDKSEYRAHFSFVVLYSQFLVLISIQTHHKSLKQLIKKIFDVKNIQKYFHFHCGWVIKSRYQSEYRGEYRYDAQFWNILLFEIGRMNRIPQNGAFA